MDNQIFYKGVSTLPPPQHSPPSPPPTHQFSQNHNALLSMHFVLGSLYLDTERQNYTKEKSYKIRYAIVPFSHIVHSYSCNLT